MTTLHLDSGADSRPVALVVEDDASAGEIASAMLGLLGYDARVAADGTAALRALADGAPDLLMLDVCLPDLDGPKVLKIARRLKDSATVPTIAASAVVQRGAPEVDELRSLGVSEFLGKPFNLPALRNALARAHPSGPCGAGRRQARRIDGALLWPEGRATAQVREARPLLVRFDTEGRGLTRGLEVQLKLERVWEEDGDEVRIPVRLFGSITDTRPVDGGTRAEITVQAAVPREHWLGLCDDLTS